LYLEIESLRFDNLFDFQISINGEVDAHSVFIPPMILQPFVENSIIHGITPKKEGGLISIIINWEDEFLSCEIDDDGIGRDESFKVNSTLTGSHKSLGMSVTKERLDAMSSLIGDKAKIEITDKKDDEGNSTGTKVKILIPVESVI